MIEKCNYKDFAKELSKKKPGVFPHNALIELTYRCPLNCVHCYCKNITQKELTTKQWKKIFDQLHTAGTLYLTLTGGDPLMRDDFWELYEYVRTKGFLVTLFLSGYLLDDISIERLAKNMPALIEITFNAVSGDVFENISRVKGSFGKIKRVVEQCVDSRLPLVLKAVGLTENKSQILDIKQYAEKLLGPKKFKFDSFITPKLDGTTEVCAYRLPALAITALEECDADMRKQREEEFEKHKVVSRGVGYKYHCNSWFKQAHITPSGELRFCNLSDKFTYDLTQTNFEDAFYSRVEIIQSQKHSERFECLACGLKEFCYYCPARAYVEVGNEAMPVPYYCELAAERKKRFEKCHKIKG